MIKRSLLLSLLLVGGSLQAQEQAPDLAKAKQIAETICVACHAADGNSQLSANPKIAGQVKEYLAKQLTEFKSGARQDPAMSAMAALVADEDIAAVAQYYASQTLQPEPTKNLETVELGQKIWRAGIADKGVPACAACHGPTGSGMPAQYPRLSGQFAEYTTLQLQKFRDGGRANDPNQMMRMIALKMTDAEMRAVADYAAGLR
ncbi:cytochrome c4 [Thauera sp. CAU 1555]|uniref:Cytochrome c4 n=1 Tax=Thauera sedimentorum TaxID=2767595 RepID=A0ABR9BH04_9RHOO|nr:c-type cytochrome [Thauera sedimentorum]MBC9073851.1 cytochrome c4 [Thauera sedimentorum]MBD8504770.1 cytochrome c4 [Thauera sedimentorum]